MTIDRNKLKAAIDLGKDIEFSYGNKAYTILPWTDDGIVIGPQDSDNDEFYKTSDELISNYKIDGKPIKDIVQDLNILLI